MLQRAPGETVEERESRVAAWLRARARADNTARAYGVAWRCWERWATARGVDLDCPSEIDIEGWLAASVISGLAPGTIGGYLIGVRRRYAAAGLRVGYGDGVRQVLSGLRRELPRRQRQARPLTAGLLRRCLEAYPRGRGGYLTATGTRNCALLLVGYCGGLRRSELVALNWRDLEWVEGADGVAARAPAAHVYCPPGAADCPARAPDAQLERDSSAGWDSPARRGGALGQSPGVVLTLRGTKGRQGGTEYVGIGSASDGAVCPIAALREWMLLADGMPLFSGVGRRRGARLQSETVSRVVRSAVKRIGLDPEGFSGHSLRAGLVTDLAPEVEAVVGMRQSRHRSAEMWGRYYRPADAMGVNYTRIAGL